MCETIWQVSNRTHGSFVDSVYHTRTHAEKKRRLYALPASSAASNTTAYYLPLLSHRKWRAKLVTYRNHQQSVPCLKHIINWKREQSVPCLKHHITQISSDGAGFAHTFLNVRTPTSPKNTRDLQLKVEKFQIKCAGGSLRTPRAISIPPFKSRHSYGILKSQYVDT